MPSITELKFVDAFNMFILRIFFALLLSAPAYACTFDDVVRSNCPADEVQDEMLDRPTPDRSVFATKYSWKKLNEFKSADIVELKVCIFERPAKSVFKAVNGRNKVDFSKNKASLNKIARKIESAARAWTEVTSSFGNNAYLSSIRFDFFDSDGSARTCEKYPKSHILIVIVTNGLSSSDIGFRQWKTATASTKTPLSNMAILQTAATTDIRHEFGHILGFVHEMGHNSWKECADAFDVKSFAEARNVSEDTVKSAVQTVAERYKKASLVPGSKSFDKNSIMAYSLEPRFFIQKELQALTPKDCSMSPSGNLMPDDQVLLLRNYKIVKRPGDTSSSPKDSEQNEKPTPNGQGGNGASDR